MNFVVMGEPVGKGRPKFVVQGGFARAYTPPKTREYERKVAAAWKEQCNQCISGLPVSVVIEAYFGIPKTKAKKIHNGDYATKKPDADNIAKAILDALNGKAFDDDASVAKLRVFKQYSQEPRVEVYISEVKV